jgi:predicted DNA repair protein MutK
MSGLLALLDDVAAIAKVAAASLDDVIGQSTKAGLKAAGAVIDDAAVTPKYVHGFEAHRELPIVGQIALGSIRNKMLILLPAALLLSAFAPQVIAPLLMLGGAYLCFEGAEKVHHVLFPPSHVGEPLDEEAASAIHLEREKVAGAVKTDFILSAEIMTIALAALPGRNIWFQAVALAVVGIAITVLVYGGVALIVKADDFGLFLTRRGRLAATRALGRGIVRGMPGFMAVLSAVGTAAMIWVGGSIVIHGLAEIGFPWAEHQIEHVAELAAHAVPQMTGVVTWVVKAVLDGIIGLMLGLALIPLSHHVLVPLWQGLRGKSAPGGH